MSPSSEAPGTVALTESTAAPILVVDDNAAARYTTSRVLRAAGYQVLEASTGTAALELATRADQIGRAHV